MTKPYTPHDYQERAIKFCIERGCAGLWLDPGMGKTSIMLAVFEMLKSLGIVDQMLVLAPLRVCYSTWPDEVRKWDDFSHLTTAILHGPNKTEALRSGADILLINYEGLAWLAQQPRELLPKLLVIDESSKLKHTNTQRFKTLKKMLNHFSRRYTLTGSPASNSLLDLFGQVYCMDMGATFGPYVTAYRNEFFFQTGYGGYEWRLQPGAADKIYSRLAPRIMRLDANDYLELPPLIEVDIYVDLPPDVRKLYDDMERKLMVQLDGVDVEAANAAVASMKCRQIASGGLYTDASQKLFTHLHTAKVEAVADLLEELEGQPALIAYDFLHDLERLQKELGKDVPYIGSGVSPKRSRELIDKWNRGELPVLLGHPLSMSHGLNMQEAGRAVIWHSLTWSLEDRMQFIRRIWRQGQKGRVFVYNIIARNTVDEALMLAVKGKARGERALLDALRQYWLAKK